MCALIPKLGDREQPPDAIDELAIQDVAARSDKGAVLVQTSMRYSRQSYEWMRAARSRVFTKRDTITPTLRADFQGVGRARHALLCQGDVGAGHGPDCGGARRLRDGRGDVAVSGRCGGGPSGRAYVAGATRNARPVSLSGRGGDAAGAADGPAGVDAHPTVVGAAGGHAGGCAYASGVPPTGRDCPHCGCVAGNRAR
eukprot:ctg_510.g304